MQRNEFRRLLKGCGWTQAELGRRLGVNETTISRWKVAPKYAVAYVEMYLLYQKTQKALNSLIGDK